MAKVRLYRCAQSMLAKFDHTSNFKPSAYMVVHWEGLGQVYLRFMRSKGLAGD